RPPGGVGPPAPLPRGRRPGPEELLAHVVVDADHVEPEAGEVPDRLRADESAGSGYQGDSHVRHSRCARRRKSAASITPHPSRSAVHPNETAQTQEKTNAAERS